MDIAFASIAGISSLNGLKRVMGMSEMIKRHIDLVFFFLEGTDYGYGWERQEIEAYFWEKFFDYFEKLQKIEKNRILNQLSDLL